MTTITRRDALAVLGGASGTLAAMLSGCGSTTATSDNNTNTDSSESESSTTTTVRVGSLKGPTSIGIAYLMNQSDNGATAQQYEFSMTSTPDDLLPSVIQGDLDVALIPANAASVLYNKTDGAISVVDINTLGVLSVVSANTQIQQFSNLAGHSVYLTGKGASPEYVMNYLLSAAGIADQVTLEYKSEAAEVVSVLTEDPTAIGVLPQPYVTVATTKNTDLVALIDLNDVWDATVSDGSKLIMGVTVARNEFIQSYPDSISQFLADHAASVDEANADPDEVAPMVVSAGVLDSEQIAAKAIPNCHLVCTTGTDMQTQLAAYLNILYSQDSSSVGGSLPSDDFYYIG